MRHRLSSKVAACVASLMCLAANAEAQQALPRYSVTTLQPVLSSTGKRQVATAVALNNQGVVVGWTGKVKGTKTVYTFGSFPSGWPNPFQLVRMVKTAYETSAVRWTAGQPLTLPRASGGLNTQAWGIADDGTVLLQVEDKAGTTVFEDGSIGTAKSHWRLLQGSNMKIPLVNGQRIVATGVSSIQPTDAYVTLAPGGELLINPPAASTSVSNLLVWRNGVTTPVPVPATMPTTGRAVYKARLKALWPDGQSWLWTTANNQPELPPGTDMDQGWWWGAVGAWRLQPEDNRLADFDVQAVNRQGWGYGRGLHWVTSVDPFSGASSRSLEVEGFHVVKGPTWQRVNARGGTLYPPAFMDGQGRAFATLVTVVRDPEGVASRDVYTGRPVLIQGGETHDLATLVDTPLALDSTAGLVAVNDVGQVLVSTLKPGVGLEYHVLTPH